MSCELCLNRREFLTRSAIATVAAATLAACGDGQIGPTPISAPTVPVQVKVSDFPGLATAGVLVAIDDGRAAKRTDATTFVAFSRVCTHEGCEINVVDAGTRFQCPCHFSVFSANGAVLEGPANRGLDRLATSYDPVTDTLTIG